MRDSASLLHPVLPLASDANTSPWMAVGQTWPNNNLLWHGVAVMGAAEQVFSPVDGSLIQTAHVLAPQDLTDLFAFPISSSGWDEAKVHAFAGRLEARLRAMNELLRESLQKETAFSNIDCDEIIGGTMEYLQGFSGYYGAIQTPFPALHYDTGKIERVINLETSSWGTVAVMLPQNAMLFLGVVCILNALVTGNRVVLRSPPGSSRTAALLGLAVQQAEPPQCSVSLVVAKGREFLEAVCSCPFPALVHYLGASSFGGEILRNAFSSGKTALIDGTGNTWVWVSERSDAAQVAHILTSGATRYNGQTCTSINGAVIHPAIFDQVCDLLQEQWSRLHCGNTLEGAPVGGLFDEKQAQSCHQSVVQSGGEVMCGGNYLGNRLDPTLVRNPCWESELVRAGVFGPVLWVRPGTREEFVAQWPANRYPLCAGVLERDTDAKWWLKQLPSLARLVVNSDPSIEHIYEPWGGYPGAGANSVGFWHRKYQRTVSLDAPVAPMDGVI